MVSKVCSRSQGQPPGARSRAMRDTNCSNFSPAFMETFTVAAGGEATGRMALRRLFQRDFYLSKAPRRCRVHGGCHLRDASFDESPPACTKHHDSNFAMLQILLIAKILGGDQYFESRCLGCVQQVAISHLVPALLLLRCGARSDSAPECVGVPLSKRTSILEA